MLCDLILAYSMNFGPFFNWVVCFLIVEFKISWCILQRCPISDMCFARTQSVALLSILLTLSFTEEKCF